MLPPNSQETKLKLYMKRRIVILSTVLVFVFLMTIPFLLNEDLQKTISVSIALVSGLSSLITLFIAYILFDKYGLQKDFSKTQTEIVLSQLETIKTVRFLIRSDGKFLQFFPVKNRIESYEFLYSDKLIFNKKYWDYMNHIFQFSSSIYMPKEIVAKINRLKPSVIEHINAMEMDSYSKVTFWGENEKDAIYGKLNAEDITFQEFYTCWIDILDEISNWLKDKIAVDKLNIDF